MPRFQQADLQSLLERSEHRVGAAQRRFHVFPQASFGHVFQDQVEVRDDARERAAHVVDHQGEHLVLGVLQLGQLLELETDERVLRTEPEEGAHPEQQLPPVDRLGEEIVRAGLQSQVPLLLFRERRHQQHGQERLARALLHSFADLVSGHSRHHHVEQHQVDALRPEQLEGRGSAGGFQDAVVGAEHGAKQRAVLLLVVHDQDGRAGFHAPSPALSAWASSSSASSCRASAAG